MTPVHIPDLNKKKLRELYQRIKPVRLTNRGYREIIGHLGHDGVEKHLFSEEPSGLEDIAFLWSPVLGEPVRGLAKLATISTYHSCAYHGFFKPSIEEVLAQISRTYIDQVVAFSTSKDAEVVWPKAEYHVTTTTLFRKREKQKK